MRAAVSRKPSRSARNTLTPSWCSPSWTASVTAASAPDGVAGQLVRRSPGQAEAALALGDDARGERRRRHGERAFRQGRRRPRATGGRPRRSCESKPARQAVTCADREAVGARRAAPRTAGALGELHHVAAGGATISARSSGSRGSSPPGTASTWWSHRRVRQRRRRCSTGRCGALGRITVGSGAGTQGRQVRSGTQSSPISRTRPSGPPRREGPRSAGRVLVDAVGTRLARVEERLRRRPGGTGPRRRSTRSTATRREQRRSAVPGRHPAQSPTGDHQVGLGRRAPSAIQRGWSGRRPSPVSRSPAARAGIVDLERRRSRPRARSLCRRPAAGRRSSHTRSRSPARRSGRRSGRPTAAPPSRAAPGRAAAAASRPGRSVPAGSRSDVRLLDLGRGCVGVARYSRCRLSALPHAPSLAARSRGCPAPSGRSSRSVAAAALASAAASGPWGRDPHHLGPLAALARRRLRPRTAAGDRRRPVPVRSPRRCGRTPTIG